MRRETMMRETYIKIEFPAWRNGVVEATIGRLFVPKQGLVDQKDDAETKVDAIMSVRVVARYCKVQFLPVYLYSTHHDDRLITFRYRRSANYTTKLLPDSLSQHSYRTNDPTKGR
jgi:hypothetical protein